jgi:hypothetical protein
MRRTELALHDDGYGQGETTIEEVSDRMCPILVDRCTGSCLVPLLKAPPLTNARTQVHDPLFNHCTSND